MSPEKLAYYVSFLISLDGDEGDGPVAGDPIGPKTFRPPPVPGQNLGSRAQGGIRIDQAIAPDAGTGGLHRERFEDAGAAPGPWSRQGALPVEGGGLSVLLSQFQGLLAGGGDQGHEHHGRRLSRDDPNPLTQRNDGIQDCSRRMGKRAAVQDGRWAGGHPPHGL